jgi:hypothetical protein
VREEGDTALLGHRHGGVVGAGWASPLGPSCERGKPFRHQELPSERDWLLGCCSCGHRHSCGCHLCNKIHQERAIEDPLRTSATAKIDHKKNENKKYSSSFCMQMVGWPAPLHGQMKPRRRPDAKSSSDKKRAEKSQTQHIPSPMLICSKHRAFHGHSI